MNKDREPIGRGQGNELLNKLEARGLDSKLAQKVIDSPDNQLAGQVVEFAQTGGVQPTTSQQRARKIMERNMFGVEEAVKHYGVVPTKRQLIALAQVPFDEAILEACKVTHVLVAVFPLSILDIREKATVAFYNQDWYNDEAFAADKGEIGWHLICKTPVPDSTSKTWDQQRSLLGSDDETPTAQVLAYTIIGYFLATGERLFENVYVRTSSVSSDGDRVVLGVFGSGGLDVSRCFGGNRRGSLGVASARKL